MAERGGLLHWLHFGRRDTPEIDPLVAEALRRQGQFKQEVTGLMSHLFTNEFDERLSLISFKKHWRGAMPKLGEFLAPDFDSFDLVSIIVFQQGEGELKKFYIRLNFEDPGFAPNLPIAEAMLDFNSASEVSSSMSTEFGLAYRVRRGSDKKDPFADAHRLSMMVG